MATRVRPLGLLFGDDARAARKAGVARPIAGDYAAFAACEVREGGGPARVAAAVSLPAVGIDWAAVGAPRESPLGGPLLRPLIMGIVNLTPDSFSEPGIHMDAQAAIAHALALAEAGADILDLGAESTRPGAAPIDAAEERRRLEPVLAGLAAAELGPIVLSVDSRRAETMRLALDHGARILNDVSALTHDPASLAVVAASEAMAVLMHMRGEPATMNQDPRYEDVVGEVYDELAARVAACTAAGIAHARLIVDPGFGFAKRSRHNLALLEHLSVFHGLGCLLMAGLSRKALIGGRVREKDPAKRAPESIAAALAALDQGAQILRVHDVAETRRALDIWEHAKGIVDDGG